MSATIGTRLARTICRSAAVLSLSGQLTRMMSTPASSQRRIWSIVAVASEVGVLVIVWTVTGASPPTGRSEEHTSELQSLMRLSYAVFCLTTKTIDTTAVH